MLEIYDRMNKLLLAWNLSGKSQRFGQYLEGKLEIDIPNNLYYSEDSYFVYDSILTLLEKHNEN